MQLQLVRCNNMRTFIASNVSRDRLQTKFALVTKIVKFQNNNIGRYAPLLTKTSPRKWE